MVHFKKSYLNLTSDFTQAELIRGVWMVHNRAADQKCVIALNCSVLYELTVVF